MAKRDFLQIYREYEAVLRDRNSTAQQHEEALDDATAGKLRICRLMRNFATHSDEPGFIEFSDRQAAFLDRYVSKLKSEGDTVKKHSLSPAKAIFKETDRCQGVLALMAKGRLNEAVVLTKNGYRTAGIHEIVAKGLQSKTTQMAALPLKTRPTFVAQDDGYASVPEGTVAVVTVDGTERGKIVGVLYK